MPETYPVISTVRFCFEAIADTFLVEANRRCAGAAFHPEVYGLVYVHGSITTLVCRHFQTS